MEIQAAQLSPWGEKFICGNVIFFFFITGRIMTWSTTQPNDACVLPSYHIVHYWGHALLLISSITCSPTASCPHALLLRSIWIHITNGNVSPCRDMKARRDAGTVLMRATLTESQSWRNTDLYASPGTELPALWTTDPNYISAAAIFQ